MAGGSKKNYQPVTKARKLDWYPKASEDVAPKISYKDIEITVYGGGAVSGSKADQQQVMQWTNRVKNEHKQSGSYSGWTAKERVSTGETHKEKGKVGTRDEWKSSTTVKVGNKRGYTEIYREERVRNVDFGDGKSSTENGRGCSFVTNYDYNYDYDYDYDY